MPGDAGGHAMNPRYPLLLFVCAGNICRSPMAEAIAADRIEREALRLRVASAGLVAMIGEGATEHTRSAIEALGLRLDAHRARALSRAEVDEAVLVVTATARQRDELRRTFVTQREKIVSFDDVTGLGDVDDPFGGEEPEFHRTAALIQAGMPYILAAATRRK
jgi:protein-tyrosine-phosphatase